MDKLTVDAIRVRDEIYAANPNTGSKEHYLLSVLDRFIETLEIGGEPQRGSTDALSRFCVESLDWSSPLYKRCVALIENARARF